MVLLTGFAFLAGIITVLSPCVLPVLPIILSGSVGTGRRRPAGVVAGFLFTFTLLTMSLSFIVRVIGVDPGVLRYSAAAVIVLFAAVLIVPALKDRFMMKASMLVSRSSRRRTNPESEGFLAGFVTGSTLGVVWTPCVGPIMASVITLAASRSLDAGAFFITAAYTSGTALPLFAVMKGGRSLISKFPGLSKNLAGMQRIFGVLMLAAGIALFTGWDRDFQNWLLSTFPSYGSGLTAIEDNEYVRRALDRRSSEADKPDIPDRNGSDPLTRTSGNWFNSNPLTLEGLKGSVVMVDFWTYSCINCIRTLPHLKQLHQRYAGSGLVIIGVHTPEFAFEREAANLGKAIRDLGVIWPVVQDNDYGIWNAFSNRYWPAHYIFDKEGKLVNTHFGEGAYAETENIIRELLGEDGAFPGSTGEADAGYRQDINPETYLGSGRGTVQQPAVEGGSIYKTEKMPEDFAWLLEGNWKQEDEYVSPAGGGKLYLNFRARKIFLVIGTDGGKDSRLRVLVNGKPSSGGEAAGGLIYPRENRLYTLLSSGKTESGILTVEVTGDVRLYAFTFE